MYFIKKVILYKLVVYSVPKTWKLRDELKVVFDL